MQSELTKALFLALELFADDADKITIPKQFLRHFKNPIHAIIYKDIVFWWAKKRGASNYRSAASMAEEFGMSLDQAKRAVSQLRSKGYITTEKTMVNGSATNTYQVVPELLADMLDHSAISHVAKSDIAPSITDITTDITKPLKDIDRNEEHFERFWQSGMVKTNKKAAKSAFKSILKKQSEPDTFTNSLINDVKNRLRLKQYGFDKLHPTSYLNGERWTDDYPQAAVEAQTSFDRLTDTSWADGIIAKGSNIITADEQLAIQEGFSRE